MPATYTLIASNTLSSSAASVTFSSIPGTYTDLVLRTTVRSDAAGLVGGNFYLQFNSDTASNYSWTYIAAAGATAGSNRSSTTTTIDGAPYAIDSAGNTANTFTTIEVYLPSYLVSQNKPVSVFAVAEQNSTGNNSINAVAGLWRNTSALTGITITGTGNFVSGSSFFLYGIKNS